MIYQWFTNPRALAIGTLLIVFCGSVAEAATPEDERKWPSSPPSLGLLQTRPVFSLATSRQLEGLLVQHESLTGEKVLLVVSPADGKEPPREADEQATLLAQLWKLDTTRRGNALLLVIQEHSPGKLRVGYRAGEGVSKSQVADKEELEHLEDAISEAGSEGSWDEIAEISAIWLFQTLNSPLLERPELLYFQEKSGRARVAAEVKQPDEPRSGGSRFGIVTLLIIAVMIAAMALVLEAVRQGLRPQVLLGSQRVVKFGVHDKIRRVAKKVFRSQSNQDRAFSIEIIEGQN